MTDRKENRKHLFYLNELSDFKVDSDDPDVRGWPVKDVDNKVVGKVDNLLVSKQKKRVVYLDVEVDKSIIDANHDPYGKPASGNVHEFINKEGENHLILPVGLARLNTDENFVYTDEIDHQTFAETKRKAKGYDVDRDYEVVVLESYNRGRDFDRDRETTVKTRERDTGMDGNKNTMSQTGKDRNTDLTGTDRDRNAGTRTTDSNLTERDRITDRDRNTNVTGPDGDKVGTGDTDSNITGRDRGTDVAGRDRDADLGNRDRDTNLDRDRDRNIGTSSDKDLDEERRSMREGDRNNDFNREGNIAGRSGTLADNERRTVDRDRDALTGDEDGKRSDRRASGTIPEDDSFYDRGEFDYAKYRR